MISKRIKKATPERSSDLSSRRDPLSRHERSKRMARVRSTGNRSTEMVVERVLRAEGIRGWRKHPSQIPGRPDFYFGAAKLAFFVDGCFWHACPSCARRTPRYRRQFWSKKLLANRRRDIRVRRNLVRLGFRTMRVWEHELNRSLWIKRLQKRLCRHPE